MGRMGYAPELGAPLGLVMNNNLLGTTNTTTARLGQGSWKDPNLYLGCPARKQWTVLTVPRHVSASVYGFNASFPRPTG